MKIFIDIGHPAHVHYFVNFIRIMKSKGHVFFVTARDKEVAFSLLNYFNIPFESRGKGKKGIIGKLIYLLIGDTKILKFARKFKPDIFLSFGSSYAAQVAWLTRKPHIAFDDTDHALLEHLMYAPFSKSILTPWVYQKDYGKKHIRFNSFMELCSLHPNYFKPNPEVLSLIGISQNERFVLLRFVSWQASHDIGLSGLSHDSKIKLVKELSCYGKVIISSEETLPNELSKFAYSIHPALIHHALFYASLLVGESLTMAAEAAFLGTPAICISTALAGTLDEEVKLGMIELFRTSEGMIERAKQIFSDPNFKEKFLDKSTAITKSKIDITALMIWFVENYPQSSKILKKNPDYQYKFK